MNKELKHSSGTIEFTRTGNAFLISESKKLKKDIFIPRSKTGRALNGDKVFVKISRKNDGSGDVFGEVVGITKRFRVDFVGVIEQDSKTGVFVVKTFSKKMPIEFYVTKENVPASVGDKVLVRISRDKIRDGRMPCIIKRSFGKAGEHQTEMSAILYENNIDSTFPKAVVDEANAISFDIPEEEIAKREDFRQTVVFTIDPETAKDFDDALSIKRINEDTYEVGVHIADVGHYVKPGSALDNEAYRRSTSTYLVDRCIPMLPERLSNGVCSLRPHEEKLVFSVVFTIKFEPKHPTIENPISVKVLDKRFVKGIICSGKRYSYEQAQEVIENGHVTGSERDQFDEGVLALDVMAKIIRRERFKKGAVSFEKREVKFKLDEHGSPTGVYFKESKDSNKLIEEFMLLANQAVATYIGQKGLPCIYRTHALPSIEKLKELSAFVKQFGYDFNVTENEEQNKVNLNKLLQDVKGSNHANIIETIAVRSMSKAIYTTEVLGHYGLGFKYYSHFTSPIRRYPDVILHRLLFNLMTYGTISAPTLISQCEHCSELENKAAKAERDSIKFKQTEYMQEKIGQSFIGTVSGVNNWGLFVEIQDNGCDGLVDFEELTNLGLVLDEKNYKFVGNGMKISLGDTVKVKVNNVNLTKRQIDLSLEV